MMAKLIIYKDYDIIKELNDIYMVDRNDGRRKDQMLQVLIQNIQEALEVTIQE